MYDPSMPMPALSDRSGVTDAVRTQILTTEHWSLLATRSMTWNEVFSRASMFMTVLSAAVVALALVAQVTAFGMGFRLFALLVLPVVLLLGVMTIIRMGTASSNDIGLIIGMNRLRHAYLELAPELEPYFVTSSHDDEAGIMQSYGFGEHLSVTGFLASTPTLVATINVVIVGVLGVIVAELVGVGNPLDLLVGASAALVAALGQGVLNHSTLRYIRRTARPHFPS
jgi:hypothetical protein